MGTNLVLQDVQVGDELSEVESSSLENLLGLQLQLLGLQFILCSTDDIVYIHGSRDMPSQLGVRRLVLVQVVLHHSIE